MFDPTLSAVRFGTGLSPRIDPLARSDDVLNHLGGPDHMAARYPILEFSDLFPRAQAYRDAVRAARGAEGDARQRLRDTVRDMGREMQELQRQSMLATVARIVEAEDGFRERLTVFWSDHFTVVGKGGFTRRAVPYYIEEAIRPNVSGRFADLLKAAVLHPLMLMYLDQTTSVGPNSIAAQSAARRGRVRGMNENLAREIIELHTLGVGAAYTQTDITQFAELLTGLNARPEEGTVFNPNRGEPDPEIVLGKSYGRRTPAFEDILAALDDLAVHPDTARHISQKLAVHFVSDDPETELVDRMAAEFQRTEGDLLAVYAVLLEAQERPLMKIKQPFDYVASSLRALGVTGDRLTGLSKKQSRRLLTLPLDAMGQPWLRPTGPDGWPEDGDHWITPQGLAGRINWAMRLRRIEAVGTRDPRVFLDQALGDLASERLRFAVAASESQSEGVALILASPEFQRR